MQINEIFSSIDGEGIRSGYLVTFIRTQGCNLRCPYCDTKYSWDTGNYIEMPVNEIVARCIRMDNKRITLTGGEPLLQKDVVELLQKLTEKGFEVNIETNGSIDIRFLFDPKNNINLDNIIITIDWKGPSSLAQDKMLVTNFACLRAQDVLKFVVGTECDLLRIPQVIEYLQQPCHIFVSPIYGQMRGETIVNFLKKSKLQNVRLQLQLHKYIWPINMRGV